MSRAETGPAPVTIADIRAAAARIAGQVRRTEMDRSETLSALHGAEIWLKFENLQFTGAFKERGALNRLLQLDDDARRRGVIAMSAGNHAQGVAYHAGRLGVPAKIVMPEGTPFVKIENTRRLGADVTVTGATLEAAAAHARALEADGGLTFLHPYDDADVIAGQGTIAIEMLEDVPDLDVLIVPIGGGGLIAGMATAAKAIKPGIEVVGVQAARCPSMFNALKAAAREVRSDTLAEGIAVNAPGALPLAIAKDVVDDVVLVSEAQLEASIAELLEIEKTLVEGAGAAGLAAIASDPGRYRGRKVGLVLCGGNIDLRLLASVLTRQMARAGRLAELAIDLQDRPGQLARVAETIGSAGANIVEVAHQRTFSDLPAKAALLEVVVETRDRSHLDDTVAALQRAGFTLSVTTAGDAPAANARAVEVGGGQ
ncbi:MAG: threonine ammonia-lyase [Pseudomonadota bacterium]